ncbi:hypothetical protein [Streptomyces melanogenes]|uniref:hypothetical protein n=1 Tax=Streptomyces melanogenes TaxID=67326 RepID=UPI00167C7501|nr:hypothetical protein [Streptomyces melanogenes]GGP85657.1 hypothetical protein GCM10010278_75080 [Streptomyces melanogenes]
MSAHRAVAEEPWQGWGASGAAWAAYGEHLGRVAELVPALVYRYVMDRLSLAAAHVGGATEVLRSEAFGVALECRDDLLESGVVLDVLALCQVPGGYLPRPYREVAGGPPAGDELRTDSSDLADELVRYDLRHGTSVTGALPSALGDGCQDCERDAVRAYLRREWFAAERGRSAG